MSSSSKKMSLGIMDLFANSTVVAVISDKRWFSGGWFVAKVLDPPLSSPSTPGKMKFLVEYQSLFCYDGKLVRNCVDIKFVRPLPPPPPNDEQEQQRFEVYANVDAYCNDGWWVKVVSKVLLGEEEQRVYSFSSMKMSPGNIDLFAKDTLIEVSSADGWFPGRWFVAKVLDPPPPSPTAPGKMTFLVEYQSLLYGTKLLTRRVDIKFVRPLPPPPPNDEQEQQRFEVNDVVDAYRNNGWWVGVVSKVWVEEEQRIYSVLLENPIRAINFIVLRSSELRFHLDWVGDKWIQPQKQNKMSSEVGEKRGKLMEAETSSEKRKRGTHVKFLFKGKECGGAKGDVDKIDVEDSSTTGAAMVDNMPYENPNLRSLESSPALRFVQSLEEFQLMPQKPHFRPLDECDTVLLEGLVLKHMMTFVNVVKETSKLQVNASGNVMDSLLKCLPELESHGFNVKDVRSRLLEMQTLIKSREYLQTRLEKVKCEIRMRTHEGTNINAELIDAIEEIKVLEEKKARLISMNEENDSEIAKLKSSDSSLNEHIQNVEHNFVSLATFPWR
ncbi:hypothetical protein EZV62_004195 [Acer yangbiense]|uniref:Agenet domain-containing protein n=1 Tax=Acer yangbiense TaxID=1000413 RepID=A0A5C7IJ10_9ROSI|nr:hypothetical protein EZV62_004195 [Acer yangbiense]